MTDLVPVPAVLLERLARLGVDVPRVLREASLPRSRFEAPKARLTTREFFGLWRAIEQVGGASDVGLRLGSEALPHQYSVAFMAALHARTLGDALQQLGRYKRLTCPEELAVEVAGGEARIRVQWLLAEGSAPPALIDGTFAGVLALARRGTGKEVAARRVELARRRAGAAVLERHFGCKVRFEARADLLVLDERTLAEPFTTHNPELLALLLPGLEAELAQQLGTLSLSDDVRGVLRRRISMERPTVATVAKELGMSSRTLQRRLEELGTTYQALLGEARHEAARRLLASTDLDSGEVAFLVGFEELNSFTRAFRAWEGTTPARWRTRARAPSQAR